MKRRLIRIEDVADLGNLAWAAWRAGKGKRSRADVRAFFAHGLESLQRLREEILTGCSELGRARRFRIHDPKPRVIHAPAFRERVLHHALMRHLGPVLDAGLVDDSYACRPGRGPLAAVRRAQRHLRRFDWFVQVDMSRYFASIDHGILFAQLCRRVRGPAVLELCRQILLAHRQEEGRGLPIGALTSQHFANLFLGPLDRLLLEELRVMGMVRYMDDVVWWVRSRQEARETLSEVRGFVTEALRLTLREPSRIQKSERGMTFCGYRVHRSNLRLTPRGKRRYSAARATLERRWLRGLIGDRELQAAYASAFGITSFADAAAWRRAELARRPAPDV